MFMISNSNENIVFQIITTHYHNPFTLQLKSDTKTTGTPQKYLPKTAASLKNKLYIPFLNNTEGQQQVIYSVSLYFLTQKARNN